MRADGIILLPQELCHAVPTLLWNRKWYVFKRIIAVDLERLGAVAAEKVKNAENEQICRYSNTAFKVPSVNSDNFSKATYSRYLL